MTDPINESNPAGTPSVGDPGMTGGAPVAPPQTPSTPPAPAPKGDVPPTPQHAPTEPVNASQDGWGELTSGNAVLDSSIKAFTQSVNMSPQDFMQIVGNAIDYSDPNLIDTTLLNTKYKEHAATVHQLTEALISTLDESRAAAVNTAYEVAGSKEAWDQAVALFNANAPDYLKGTIKTMIDNGNIKEGAQMLMQTVGQYGASGTQTPRYTGNNTNARGLSFDELKTELGKLVKEAGGASLESGTYGRRYQELMRLRAIGRSQNL